MKFPPFLKVYGDPTFKGDCPVEDLEHVTFVNAVRRGYPKAAALMIHVKNEGQRTASQAQWDKIRGLNGGASDFVFPGKPALVIEMKRRDPSKCRWQKGQVEYLEAAHNSGAMACVALGWEPALEAVKDWLRVTGA